MTSRTILTAKQYKSMKLKKSKVARIINGDDEIKKRSRTSPDGQFKKFSLASQITKKKSDKKARNQCQNNAMKKNTSEKRKFGSNKKTKPRLNYECIRKAK